MVRSTRVGIYDGAAKQSKHLHSRCSTGASELGKGCVCLSNPPHALLCCLLQLLPMATVSMQAEERPFEHQAPELPLRHAVLLDPARQADSRASAPQCSAWRLPSSHKLQQLHPSLANGSCLFALPLSARLPGCQAARHAAAGIGPEAGSASAAAMHSSGAPGAFTPAPSSRCCPLLSRWPYAETS